MGCGIFALANKYIKIKYKMERVCHGQIKSREEVRQRKKERNAFSRDDEYCSINRYTHTHTRVCTLTHTLLPCVRSASHYRLLSRV